MQALIETWEISNRLNEYLLSGINEEYLHDQSVAKGRTVGEQLAHIHNVRLMWIQVIDPELFKSLQKIEKGTITKKILSSALQKSAAAMTGVLKKGFETGKIKGFKPHAQAFLGYLIAHEAHHRSQVILILKENGHPLDKKILYGLWEWGVR
jgi:uncharacterized damage-inducible protein DinB